MKEPVLAQLTALKGLPAPALKTKWRALFDTEPPPYNRRFLEHRLAYRIQELTYGGLKPETVERLEAMAEGLQERLSKRGRIENRDARLLDAGSGGELPELRSSLRSLGRAQKKGPEGCLRPFVRSDARSGLRLAARDRNT